MSTTTAETEYGVDLSEVTADVDVGDYELLTGDVGEQILKRWDEQSRWLPDDFADHATVDKTVFIVCEKEIERRLLATETVESAEVSRSTFRQTRQNVREDYEDRFDHIPRDEFEEKKAIYLDTDSISETQCSECIGTGRLDCADCGGSGLTPCRECGGRGRIETPRSCPRCEGTGVVGRRVEVGCGQCGGNGTEVIDDQCPQCRGRGEHDCPSCGGSGAFRCDLCEGEGYTVEHDLIHRQWEPEATVNYQAPAVPESVITGAEGDHLETRELGTSKEVPLHEFERRRIDVVRVDYEYDAPSLLEGLRRTASESDDSEETDAMTDGGEVKADEWQLFVVDGEFEYEEYPKSKGRQLLTVIGVILAVIILGIVYLIASGLI